jgi:hypothetical protein
MKSTDFLSELSSQTLAKYKKAAGADARAADKEGDFERGNKRFSGIIKATKKEFEKDKQKEVDEGQIYSTGGGAGQGYHWYKPRHVPNQDELQKQSGIMKGLSKIEENKGLPFPGTYEQEYNPFKRTGTERIIAMTNEEQVDEKWSEKYKRSINCSNPKGFSQRAHCQGRKKK